MRGLLSLCLLLFLALSTAQGVIFSQLPREEGTTADVESAAEALSKEEEIFDEEVDDSSPDETTVFEVPKEAPLEPVQPPSPIPQEVVMEEDAEEDEEGEMEQQMKEKDATNENDIDDDAPSPCLGMRCGPGQICEINDNGTAFCACVEYCASENEDRRRVCSNRNTTWDSDCALYRARCRCHTGDPRCEDQSDAELRVNYYGACREMAKCKPYELQEFPWRMREWLFNVMRELSNRHQLSLHFESMKKEADKDNTKRWSNAAIWKWCDLDDTGDRRVSKQELFPIRAPLMALEHCLAPFLDSCDVDMDDYISLREWGVCLGLKENEIQEKCEEHGLE